MKLSLQMILRPTEDLTLISKSFLIHTPEEKEALELSYEKYISISTCGNGSKKS